MKTKIQIIILAFYGWFYLSKEKRLIKQGLVENRTYSDPGDHIRFTVKEAWNKQFNPIT